MTAVGLRELKKEKTRLGILDAALDLFLEQGYESTTVEQIAGAVDVSPRTFFRYFTSKDHLVLWFHDQCEEIVAGTLATRPADEPPFTALMHALRAMLADMENATPQEHERFLKLRRILDENPRLVGQSVARGAETESRLAELVAARRGVKAADDQLSHLIVAWAMSTMRVGFECPRRDGGVPEITGRMAESIELAERSLRPGWDLR
ncbi:TetR family transcriptional regulator [Actinomadura sp. ATCC 31491]|uniref:TetR family transcriptional regulator n=1 Tax=Actinomadura luzonensis TaxID=2805427 RepID=A0ABT0GAM9_9ACTN|nr:TetR family transcriptional regulator [Actinomadura luzonensis]MCK2221663.1 TetR family transcriptional regulator [Actinomadura luzonensis]